MIATTQIITIYGSIIAESVSIGGVIILFLLAPVAITAQALTMDLLWTREDTEKEEKREADQQDKQADRDYDYKTKLAELRWQHKTDVAIAERTPVRTVTAPVPHWPDKRSFLSDPDRPLDLTPGRLAVMAGVTPRTARRWLADDRNGKETKPDA